MKGNFCGASHSGPVSAFVYLNVGNLVEVDKGTNFLFTPFVALRLRDSGGKQWIAVAGTVNCSTWDCTLTVMGL